MAFNIVDRCQLFLNQLIIANDGKIVTDDFVRVNFSHQTKYQYRSNGRIYYLVSSVAREKKIIYTEHGDGVKFSRQSEEYDLLHTGHDWSCLLETETVHKFCIDIDCGCVSCKNKAGFSKLDVKHDAPKLISIIVDFIKKKYTIDDLPFESCTITTGNSHGYHVIFDNFHVDHITYNVIMHDIVEHLSRRIKCIIDTPYCFPIGYGRKHVDVVKYFITRNEICDFSYADEDYHMICPYSNLTDNHIMFYHFDFVERVLHTEYENDPAYESVAMMAKKYKMIESRINMGNADEYNYETEKPVSTYTGSCSDLFLYKRAQCKNYYSLYDYYTGTYCMYIQHYALAVHDTIVCQVQNMIYSQLNTVPVNNVEEYDTTKFYDITNVVDLTAEYITDGVDIKNRTGPVFTEDDYFTHGKFTSLSSSIRADDDLESEMDDYDRDPDNNFQNIYNINKYTDSRVYMGHVLPRTEWIGILECYYNTYLNNKYIITVFMYMFDIIDEKSTFIMDLNVNVYDITSLEIMKSKTKDFIIEMLIVRSMIHGRQIIGIISDLIAAAEIYYSDHTNRLSQSATDMADDEFVDDINSTMNECAKKINSIKWNQICASIIKYSWDFMESHNRRVLFPKRVAKIIKFLYVYNHSSDIAVQNMISEFNYKCSMVSNVIDAAVVKYMKNLSNDSMTVDHFKVFDMVKQLSMSPESNSIEIIECLLKVFWKPFELVGKIMIYTIGKFEEVNPDVFASYFSDTQKISKKCKMMLKSGTSFVKPFAQNHCRQFLVMTNFPNDCGGTFYKNTILNEFENANGCVQTLLRRNYPNVNYLHMGRFKQEIYNACVDCMYALRVLVTEIKMSGIRLLFSRPVVPFNMDTVKPVRVIRAIYNNNIFALSVKDYRQILCNVDCNISRLNLLYSEYIYKKPVVIFSKVNNKCLYLFQIVYMWFVDVIVNIINSNVYENSDLNIDVIMSILFGDNTTDQIGVTPLIAQHETLTASDCQINDNNNYCTNIKTPLLHDKINNNRATLLPLDHDLLSGESVIHDGRDDSRRPDEIVYDYEQIVESKNINDYIMNVHGIKLNIPDYTQPDEIIENDMMAVDNNQIVTDNSDAMKFQKLNTGYKSNRFTAAHNKVTGNITNEQTVKVTNRNIKIKLRKILDATMMPNNKCAMAKIVDRMVCERDNTLFRIIGKDNYNIYTDNVTKLSDHNKLLILILTVHALKRVYIESGNIDNPYGACGSGVYIPVNLIAEIKNNRLAILEWMCSRESYHNKLWKYDFFTETNNANRERMLYFYLSENKQQYPWANKLMETGNDFITAICHSLMFAFILCENDMEKLEFLLRNMLGDEFPGQWNKKCIIIDGESNSGKTSFIENVYLKYMSNSTAIEPKTPAGYNAPQTELYITNFVVYKDDVNFLDGEFLKPAISKAKKTYRRNHGNEFTALYPVAHMIMSNNNLKLANADSAVYNRILLFSMNCIYGNCVNNKTSDYLFLSSDDRCRVYNNRLCDVENVTIDKFSTTDDQSVPYLFTNINEKQYINSELDINKIINGWQLITYHYSWWKFFKSISNPAGIYENTLPKSMISDFNKWLISSSPYMKWKEEVECTRISSTNISEHGMEWPIIKRNLHEYAKMNKVPADDLCVMFSREFKKYYNELFNSYYIKVNDVKFKQILNLKKK